MFTHLRKVQCSPGNRQGEYLVSRQYVSRGFDEMSEVPTGLCSRGPSLGQNGPGGKIAGRQVTISATPGNGKEFRTCDLIAQTAMDDNPLRPGGLQLTKRALSYCRFSPGATLLDVGCGKGTTVKYLREQHGLKALGLDISSALWSGGYDKHGAPPLLRASGERLPFLPRTFDGVFAECSLSVIGNPSNAIKESHRVLQRGGLLVVTDLYARVPERLSDLRRLPMTCCLTGAFLRDELIAELAAVGFSIGSLGGSFLYPEAFRSTAHFLLRVPPAILAPDGVCGTRCRPAE